MTTPLLKQIFYTALVKPLLLLLLGFNARHLERLHSGHYRLIAANHNSHLDAMVLMSLFGFRALSEIKVVAARDYFCRNPLMTWISLNIIGIIPIDRDGRSDDPLKPVREALEQGYTVIMFPEGSRGNPEQMQPLKYGIAKLMELYPQSVLTPVYMHGLGKSLPRGQNYLVPFICDINVGEQIVWREDKSQVISDLEKSFIQLADEINPKEWR